MSGETRSLEVSEWQSRAKRREAGGKSWPAALGGGRCNCLRENPISALIYVPQAERRRANRKRRGNSRRADLRRSAFRWYQMAPLRRAGRRRGPILMGRGESGARAQLAAGRLAKFAQWAPSLHVGGRPRRMSIESVWWPNWAQMGEAKREGCKRFLAALETTDIGARVWPPPPPQSGGDRSGDSNNHIMAITIFPGARAHIRIPRRAGELAVARAWAWPSLLAPWPPSGRALEAGARYERPPPHMALASETRRRATSWRPEVRAS